MELSRRNIREALAVAQSPAVLCSFGKDSLVLLALAREVCPTIPVIWLKYMANNHAFARRIIREWNLVVYSFMPADIYLLASDDGDRSLIAEYSFGDSHIPLITDLAQGTRCSLRAFPERTPQLFLPFDLLFTGYKDSDSHWLKGGSSLFPPDLRLGRAQVRAPIRHMSDEQIRAALFELNLPLDTADDALPMCTRCMTENADRVFCPEIGHEIPTEEWNQKLALGTFRQRFNLKET